MNHQQINQAKHFIPKQKLTNRLTDCFTHSLIDSIKLKAINMNNYRIISDIGSGAYSTVHKAIDVNTGHVVAIKKISQQHMNIKHIINRQVQFLHESHGHPNIIQLFKCFSVASFIYLVFEYMPMDLISFYKTVQESRKRNLNDEEISFISFQICNALKFLHEKGIMHRDIKPQNILIDPQTLNIKLIDFGFAKNNNCPTNTNYMVTRWYRPLQIVLGLPYNQKVDIFAVGALILELYLGREIFRSSSNVDQFYWIVNICGNPPQNWTKAYESMTKLNIKNEEVQPSLKKLLESVRPLASDLITKMLKTSPEQRISMTAAYEHPYFSIFKIRNVITFNKNVPLTKPMDDSMSRFEGTHNLSMKRNRAFSTEQQNHLINNLSSRQNTLQSIDKNDTFDDNIEHKRDTINSGYQKINKEQINDTVSKAEYTLGPKKYYIKRVSAEKINQNLKSREYLNEKNVKMKIQQKSRNPRNRIKSLNAHGINVVSLKKLKVHREIGNEKSFQKGKEHLRNGGETIRLNPKGQKEKPMFMRVKEKINDGKINERGDERSEMVTTLSGRRTSTSDIPTKGISSAMLKVRKVPQYKEYKFND